MIIITGIDNGLGKYLFEQSYEDELYGVSRQTKYIPKKPNVLIHCAREKEYLKEIQLINKMIRLEPSRLILMSSIDVLSRERLNDNSTYINSKIYAEDRLLNTIKIQKYNILRISALLGPYIKANTLYKIIHNLPLTVSIDSTFSFLHYDFIYNLILKIIKTDYQSNILNITASDIITVQDLIKNFNSSSTTGQHKYTTPIVDLKRLSNIIKVHTCQEAIEKYLKA